MKLSVVISGVVWLQELDGSRDGRADRRDGAEIQGRPEARL